MAQVPDARLDRANAEGASTALIHKAATQMGLTHFCISGATELSVGRGLFDLRAELEPGEVLTTEGAIPTQDGTWMCVGTITQTIRQRAAVG